MAIELSIKLRIDSLIDVCGCLLLTVGTTLHSSVEARLTIAFEIATNVVIIAITVT